MSESDTGLLDLVKEIKNAPSTWLPALLQAIIEESVKTGVFIDLKTYCDQVIDDCCAKKVIESQKTSEMSDEGMLRVLTEVFEPKEPEWVTDESCTKCGHIRPISPLNGVCYECLRKDIEE